MTNTAQTHRKPGPAFLDQGFRPFFLLSSIWAALAMVIWIMMLGGREVIPTAFDPFSWHAHEFLFGYLGGVIGGFVLTAAPNWTGRPPLSGLTLAALVGLWVAGRIAVATSGGGDWRLIMLTDLSVGVALAGHLLREILRGRQWRNLPVVLLIAVFVGGNALFHREVALGGAAFDGPGMRIGLAAALALIALIGGRIIPTFTRNWLAAKGDLSPPAPFGRADALVLGLTLVVLVGFVAWPRSTATSWLMLACGAAHLWRLSRWRGLATRSEPLLWVLHLAYAMLAMGFWAEAAAGFGLIAPAAARHVWLAGAIGLMTLAVMSRASLGHTGRPLHAGRGTLAIYLAVAGSVLTRLLAGVLPGQSWLLHLSGTLWVLAFAGFAALYLPVLIGPKRT